jgi:hypothetical protein
LICVAIPVSRVAPISKVYRAPHLPFSPFLAIPAGITVAWLLSPAFSPEVCLPIYSDFVFSHVSDGFVV